MGRQRTTLYRLALLGVVGVLAITGVGVQRMPQWFGGQDKLHHVVGLFAFALMLMQSLPRMGLLGVSLAALAVGAAIEGMQVAMPGRTASLADVLAGMAGAWLGWACVRRWRRRGRPSPDEAA